MNKDGYVLLDVLIALLILTIGFISIYDSIKAAFVSQRRHDERIELYLSESNAHEELGVEGLLQKTDDEEK